jgi:hypothetical protein
LSRADRTAFFEAYAGADLAETFHSIEMTRDVVMAYAALQGTARQRTKGSSILEMNFTHIGFASERFKMHDLNA